MSGLILSIKATTRAVSRHPTALIVATNLTGTLTSHLLLAWKIKDLDKSVDEKFLRIDTKIDKFPARVDEKFDKMEAKMDEKFGEMKEEFDKMKKNLGEMKKNLDETFGKISALLHKLEDTEK